jgi:hypothetical protein
VDARARGGVPSSVPSESARPSRQTRGRSPKAGNLDSHPVVACGSGRRAINSFAGIAVAPVGRAPGARGFAPFADWQQSHPAVRLRSFAEAGEHGEVVFNATAGEVSLAALRRRDAGNLAGKVLIDLALPLDRSAEVELSPGRRGRSAPRRSNASASRPFDPADKAPAVGAFRRPPSNRFQPVVCGTSRLPTLAVSSVCARLTATASSVAFPSFGSSPLLSLCSRSAPR